MPRSGLAGSRIRQTRLSSGLKQAELASNVGISPSYLNLIEHNRRRIGGKLLVDIARELDVDAMQLSQGAQSALLDALENATLGFADVAVETDRTEEMAGRFPGWSELIAAQHSRTETLERTLEVLNDRLTHDPQLAATMHEMLSVVTAIRSTTAILADGSPIDPEWQVRFHRNLHEDSQRLVETAQALVAFLDSTDEGQGAGQPSVPKEELESWLAARDYTINELEGPNPRPVDDILASEPKLISSATTQSFSRSYLERYRKDAGLVAQDELIASIENEGFDPLRYSQKTGVDLATILRRIACLPDSAGHTSGLVVCDSSGTLTFSKPLAGFPLPRFGMACPLWPLYQALSRPMQPVRMAVEQSGHQHPRFIAYAIAQPITALDFTAAPLFEATMLILPGDGDDPGAIEVGSSCRICSRETCRGRREPSILSSGF